jgi:malate dehydrogenase
VEKPKISVIGAGNVGGTIAYLCCLKDLGETVLIDILEGVPQGKALDICEAGPAEGVGCTVKGGNDYPLIKDSDIVVVTAGLARKPGMSRDDLVEKNTKIVSSVAEEIKKYSPGAIVIVVTNPLDAMVHIVSKVTGFAKNKIMGMAGVLDSSRFAYFISEETNVEVNKIETMVLGGHGDQMIPIIGQTTVSGKPLAEIMDKEKIDSLVERTRKGGAEIVGLLKTGSAYYAPGSAVVKMIEAILKDKKEVLPCAAYLDGEYGASGVFIGVPCKLGKEGVEEVLEIELDASEKEAFEKNVEHVKGLMKATGA